MMTDTPFVSPAKDKSRERLKIQSQELVLALQSKGKGLYGEILKNFVIDP
jgi:hypothetical protein